MRGSRRSSLFLQRFTQLILAVLLFTAAVVSGYKPLNKTKKVYPDYMYKEDGDPIIELISDGGNTTQPDFIYGQNNGARVVEFYQPWCAHCRKFRSHYIKLAKQVNELGKEHGYPPVEFHSVSCQANRKLCKSFGMNGYPQIKLFAPNSSNITADLKLKELHPIHILNKLQLQAGKPNFGTPSDESSAEESFSLGTIRSLVQRSDPEPSATVKYKRTKQQIFDDAFLSFDYTLRNSIFASEGPLSFDRKKAISNMLELMKKSLPLGWEPQRIAHALLDNFDQIASSEDQMIALIEKFDSPTAEWSPGCTKEQVGMGYTCGLWTLFHITTIGMTEWNKLDNDRTMSIAADEAGDTVRDFIFQFFGCEECRNHFVDAYDNCAFDRCERLKSTRMMYAWREFPLWFHDMHNGVNLRLWKEKAEENNQNVTNVDESRAYWPTRADCPTCWKNGERDKDEVFKYLRLEYWPEDKTSTIYRMELGIIDNKVESEGSGRTQPDLPAIFPMISGVPLALLLFLSVLCRRRWGEAKRGLLKRSHSARNANRMKPDHATTSPQLLKSPRRAASPRRRMAHWDSESTATQSTVDTKSTLGSIPFANPL